jgi:hypothetical protein
MGKDEERRGKEGGEEGRERREGEGGRRKEEGRGRREEEGGWRTDERGRRKEGGARRKEEEGYLSFTLSAQVLTTPFHIPTLTPYPAVLGSLAPLQVQYWYSGGG